MAKPSPNRLPCPWILNSTKISQFVAVRGTLEKIQPSREGLSDASRMYLSVRMIVSPPKSHHRLCMSESRYGGSRLCVRNEIALISGSSVKPPDLAETPVRLAAKRHTAAQELANNMVAQCLTIRSLIPAIPKLPGAQVMLDAEERME